MVVLVLALLLALAMLVAVVVAPLLADARGRNPPRLVTRAGKNNAPKVVSVVVFVVAFVLLLGFFISTRSRQDIWLDAWVSHPGSTIP